MEEDVIIMPLTMANPGEVNTIRKVGGSAAVRKHLEHLGFVAGSDITVVSALNGNLIVNVKETRVAISREMAGKILI
mgnify:FL=1|jgi:ferrous iron transport protein A